MKRNSFKLKFLSVTLAAALLSGSAFSVWADEPGPAETSDGSVTETGITSESSETVETGSTSGSSETGTEVSASAYSETGTEVSASAGSETGSDESASGSSASSGTETTSGDSTSAETGSLQPLQSPKPEMCLSNKEKSPA